ncbi:MAG: cell division protein SepF [Oscillatoriales cyanobacterium SM2_1_8]|nr:cell division protein SepF [Oscillatoriales cyanobacterium SM2_1_8]
MGIFNRLKDFVGLSEQEYEYDEMEGGEYQGLYREEAPEPAIEEEPLPAPRRTRERVVARAVDPSSNVIGMPGTGGVSQVLLMEPRSFDEMPQAIQALRERKSVVLNLTMMEPDQAQRAVDFVAGGTYAMDGHQERIGDSIFLFAPSCVQVTTQSSVVGEPPMSNRTRTAPPPAWSEEPLRFAQQ